MLVGYHTNSLADHSLEDAIEVVAGIGYQAIAITLDHRTLNPESANLAQAIAKTRASLSQHELTPVIETGARYLLDPWNKHQPTMISASEGDRLRRVNLLRRAIDIARLLDAHCVSFWSGAPLDEAPREEHFRRLVESLRPVIEYAAAQQVTLGFEPEPGHLIDTMASFGELLETLPNQLAEELRLTIDVGHLHCMGEGPISAQLESWSSKLANVHIEDMRHGVHEHLPFSDGEIDFPPIFLALEKIGYQGPITVELPRQSHLGPETAKRSYEFLVPLVQR